MSDFNATHTNNNGQTALHSAVLYGNGSELLLDTEKFDHALQWQNRLTPQNLAETLGNPQTVRAVTTGKSAMSAYERLGHGKKPS
jgi:ankyrin repeat protein